MIWKRCISRHVVRSVKETIVRWWSLSESMYVWCLMRPIVLFLKRKIYLFTGTRPVNHVPGEGVGNNAKEIAWLTLLAVILVEAASQSFIRQNSDCAMSRYDDLSPLFNSTFPLCCSHAPDGNWCSLLSQTWCSVEKCLKHSGALFQSESNVAANSRNSKCIKLKWECRCVWAFVVCVLVSEFRHIPAALNFWS